MRSQIERGFTLIELKASMFLGMIVVMLCGMVLQFEWSRHVLVREQDQVTKVMAQLDSQLFYLIWDCQWLEVKRGECRFVLENGIWTLNKMGLDCNGRSVLPNGTRIDLQMIQVSNDQLQVTGSINCEATTESFEYAYPLMGKYWGEK